MQNKASTKVQILANCCWKWWGHAKHSSQLPRAPCLLWVADFILSLSSGANTSISRNVPLYKPPLTVTLWPYIPGAKQQGKRQQIFSSQIWLWPLSDDHYFTHLPPGQGDEIQPTHWPNSGSAALLLYDFLGVTLRYYPGLQMANNDNEDVLQLVDSAHVVLSQHLSAKYNMIEARVCTCWRMCYADMIT